jgi:hypothetical protein
MRDFTLNQYHLLLRTLLHNGYSFKTFREIKEKPKEKYIILRHDVDQLPLNSLKTAQIENELGIRGSYYFRIVSGSFNENVIKLIAEQGHEIGYHYEDLTLAKGNIEKAYSSFCTNLEKLQKLYPVKTICMHGSPKSKWDSRDIWEKYDYRNLGIIAEPYYDIDFNNVYYITDTGRRWDGSKVSLRDKPMQQVVTQWPTYHSTFNIIKALNEGTFPNVAMMTIHPQRWTNNPILWVKELILQNLKNQVKKVLVKN